MLSSIHPLGERARGNRWGTTATWYLLGSVAGGSTMGVISGSLGAVLFSGTSASTITIAVVALAVLAAAADGFGWRVPSPERQVNESWLTRYRSWVYGAGFGFELGTGVMTFIKTATVYLLWVLATLTASPVYGGLIGAWFGLVRGAALLTVRTVVDPASLRSYFRRMARLAPAGRWAAIGAALVAAAVAPLELMR